LLSSTSLLAAIAALNHEEWSLRRALATRSTANSRMTAGKVGCSTVTALIRGAKMKRSAPTSDAATYASPRTRRCRSGSSAKAGTSRSSVT
jgi:hypothetical protein